MSTEVEHNLYVSYDLKNGRKDDQIDAIAAEFGFEWSHRGAGYGTRDLEYRREMALDPFKIAALRAKLVPLGLIEARYVHETWADDDNQILVEVQFVAEAA